jgi:serine/threonine protein kinase
VPACVQAPEVLNSFVLESVNGTSTASEETQQPYSSKVDIWAVGILTFCVLTGTYPFTYTSIQDLMARLHRHDLRIPRYLSTVAASFMQRALEYDADERPSALSLLQHPWLKCLGCIVPVNLNTLQWKHLRVAPEDGLGVLELLECPQGLDQAQYDGLCRLRFHNSGFHPANIATSGPAHNNADGVNSGFGPALLLPTTCVSWPPLNSSWWHCVPVREGRFRAMCNGAPCCAGATLCKRRC